MTAQELPVALAPPTVSPTSDSVLEGALGWSAPGGDAGDDHAMVWGAVRHATGGGKRFRPELVLRVHEALGGVNHDAVAVVGAGVELLHGAFLIHDDLIDGDLLRRGRPSVPGLFRAHAAGLGHPAEDARFATAGSVLSGDLALSTALLTFARAPVPGPVRAQLLDLVEEAVHVSAAGELADVRLSMGETEPGLDEVITMEERKTAVYSFSLPMRAAALLAGAGPGLVDAIGEAGRLLGIAYQLTDDLAGVFADDARLGKSVLGDLREGKRTPLMVHARTTSAWPVVVRHLGDPDLDAGGAAVVVEALERHGTRSHVEGLARGYLVAGQQQAAACGLPSELTDWLGRVCGGLREGAA